MTPATSRREAEALFAPAVADLVTAALDTSGLARLAGPAVLAGVREQLTAHACRVAARTLVAELHDGAHGDFAEFLDSYVPSRRARRQPVLERLLRKSLALRAAAAAEVLTRLAADRDRIVATLLDGVDPGEVADLRLGAGDTHRSGRSVCVLRFADGRRLVAKPRDLDVHLAFDAVLACVVPALECRQPRVLATAPDWGWAEHVGPAPCRDRAQLARFHHRLGALLAILHVLRASDLHCENVVAVGEHPMLIDLETMLQPRPADTGAGPDDPARRALAGSVLATALLPQPRPGPDLSGIGGDPHPGQAPLVGWADAGTTAMRLVREPVGFPGAGNRPTLAGASVEPADHVADLLAGFRAGYDALIARRDELLRPGGPLDRLAARPMRVILRDSAVYARLLDECTHPAALGAPADRRAALRQLGGHGTQLDPRAVDDEIDQLERGDIPMFTCDPRSTSVRGSAGVVAAMDESGWDAAVRTLRGLNAADRERQAWLIAASVTARRAGASPAPVRPVPPGVDGALDLTGAIALGDRLIADAIDDGRRCNWLGLYRGVGERAAVLPLGADLGEGYLGVALFLGELSNVTGSTRHREHAVRALVDLPAVLERAAADPAAVAALGPGGFAGAGGIAYALARLSRLLPDAVPAASLAIAVELTVRAASSCADPTVAAGRAGALLALLAVARLCPEHAATARAGAAAIADGLTCSTPAGLPVDDLMRGRAGIAYALARAADELDRTELRAAAATVLDDGPPPQAAAGLAARAVAGDAVAPDGFLARRLAALLAEATPAAHDALEGGVAGLLELGARVEPRGRLQRTARSADLADLADRAAHDPDALRCDGGADVPGPGLLHGLAGIGLGLLRASRPDLVPATTLLEASPVGNRYAPPMSHPTNRKEAP